jgi:hypothetical protein
VRAVDGQLVTGPHGQRDAQRLVEPLEPLGGRRQGQARAAALVLLVPGADRRASARPPERTSSVVTALNQQRRLAER